MSRARGVLFVAAILVSVAPLAAGEAIPSAVLQSTDGTVAVTVRSHTATVESHGEVTELGLRPETTPYRIEGLGEGWVLAGIKSAEPEIVVMAYSANRTELLRSPVTTPGTSKRNPVPLVDGDELVGLAWLEGADSDHLGVRAAQREVDTWGVTVDVARSGTGSQIALSGAVLSDGSWLLVWSAFDGADDEIHWCRRRVDGNWGEVQRVHRDNDVPDITPAVIATASGALLAWSRYDGNDYRVAVARWERGEWSLPRVTGDRGSVFPQWLGVEGRQFVLYRRSHPGAWVVVETDDRGVGLGHWVAEALPGPTPVVRLQQGSPRLRFADGRSVAPSLQLAPR